MFRGLSIASSPISSTAVCALTRSCSLLSSSNTIFDSSFSTVTLSCFDIATVFSMYLWLCTSCDTCVRMIPKGQNGCCTTSVICCSICTKINLFSMICSPFSFKIIPHFQTYQLPIFKYNLPVFTEWPRFNWTKANSDGVVTAAEAWPCSHDF